MSIKKQVIWDKKNKKFAGTTDYGPILAEEQDSIAQNALVTELKTKLSNLQCFIMSLLSRNNCLTKLTQLLTYIISYYICPDMSTHPVDYLEAQKAPMLFLWDI
jgi:hypothetical protein